jgi:hypothetical protein
MSWHTAGTNCSNLQTALMMSTMLMLQPTHRMFHPQSSPAPCCIVYSCTQWAADTSRRRRGVFHPNECHECILRSWLHVLCHIVCFLVRVAACRFNSPADRAHIKAQRGAIWAWLRGLGANLIK